MTIKSLKKTKVLAALLSILVGAAPAAQAKGKHRRPKTTQTAATTTDPSPSPAPSAPVAAVLSPPLLEGELKLSQVDQKNLSGYQQDEGDQVVWKQIVEEARTFIRYRRSQMNTKQKLNWVANCLAKPKESVFCGFLLEKDAPATTPLPISELPSAEPVPPSPDVAKIVEAMNKADLASLKFVPEGPIFRALRSFPKWEPLAKLADTAIKSPECASPALLMILGLKAEEYFPDPAMRELSLALYNRAVACGDQSEEVQQKARFRLTLQYLWADRCKEADPHLIKLSEKKENEFASRALYWRIHCALIAGNKLQATKLKGRMLREFPLSFHGMILNKKPIHSLAKIVETKDPLVQFRSRARPELNDFIRGVEALQALGAPDLALELLDTADNKLDHAESAFRLYLALLTMRSGDRIGKFKLLSGLFREDSTMISRTTMELFYPLARFEVLQQYGLKVDPMLMAALIRQESGFNERARSSAGALGLMQLMPATARMMERVSRRQLFDPKINVRLGVRYFRGLLERYGSDVELALAAYNAGPDKVDEWVRRYTTQDRVLFLDMIPFAETRNYVALIVRNYIWYNFLYGERLTQKYDSAQVKIKSLKKTHASL